MKLLEAVCMVRMVFNTTISRKIVGRNFPELTAGVDKLKFVYRFKYWENIITEDMRDENIEID